jgi:hypothetical protein
VKYGTMYYAQCLSPAFQNSEGRFHELLSDIALLSSIIGNLGSLGKKMSLPPKLLAGARLNERGQERTHEKIETFVNDTQIGHSGFGIKYVTMTGKLDDSNSVGKVEGFGWKFDLQTILRFPNQTRKSLRPFHPLRLRANQQPKGQRLGETSPSPRTSKMTTMKTQQKGLGASFPLQSP